MIPYAKGKQPKEEDYETEIKKVHWYHKVLLNQPLKVVGAGLLLSVLAPLLVYHYLFHSSLDIPPPDGFSTGSCLLPRTSRLPCGLGNINDTECHTQCCYDYELNLCFHRFPSRFTYIIEGEEWTENIILPPRIDTVPFKRQATTHIKLAIDEITSTHVAIVFYDPEQMEVEQRRIDVKNYTWHVSAPEMNIIINDTKGYDMFNTVRGPIIASENIWEIAFKTTDEAMYGFGEIPLAEGTVKVLYNHEGNSDAIPLIFSKTNDTYHGLLIDIVEPTEMRVEGDNQVVIRSITKRGIKFHLFAGPEPEDIMREVMDIIGFKNDLEYWMLGVHICSEVSSATDAYDDLVEFATTAANEKLPYDSHCGVAPFKFHDDCQEYAHKDELLKGKEVIKRYNKRYVPHLSPYILYKQEEITEDNSTEIIEPRSHHHTNCSNLMPQFENFILRTANTLDLYKGKVNNKTVIYPDYETISDEFMDKLYDGPEVDGLVLENSWPTDESLKSHNETYVLLPYFNENFGAAFNNTPQWNITKPNNETYIYKHNKYGSHLTEAFRHMTQKRVPIFTSSQWMTSEIVNRQSIDPSWTNLQKELTDAALGGISGRWYWSSPICGDTENYNNTTQSHLCVKWYMAATFLPLIKIHSKEVLRHPLSFSGTNKANILKGLSHRYSLLPYFYTTLQKGPLLRPMFYQFPFSKNITNLKTQFSIGNDLLIVPNLRPSQTHVHVTMPPGDWYEFWSGLPLGTEEGETVTMTTTDADFLVLMRAGAIVVLQKNVRESAEETRRNSEFSVTIALHCDIMNTTDTFKQRTPREEELNAACDAKGYLYMNENMTLIFEADSEELTVTAEGEDFKTFCDAQEATWASMMREINIYGLHAKHNNYDNFRNVVAWSNLCQLETQDKVVVKLV